MKIKGRTMKTILEVLNLVDRKDDTSILLDLIDDEVMRCKNSGDLLGAGEWLASKLLYVDEDQADEIISKTIALWACPLEIKIFPSCIEDLYLKIDEFVPEELAIALVAVKSRMLHSPYSVPAKVNDLVFRLSQQLSATFEVESRRRGEILNLAVAKFENIFAELLSTVDSFTNTNCVTAKIASIEVVKKGHQLKKIALARERTILSEVDILLGATFRKFCECCERQETKGIINRAPDLKEQALRVSSSTEGRINSVIWNQIIARIAQHVLKLVDEGSRRSELATTPSLKLVSSIVKLDLSRLGREMTFSCRLINQGEGRASKVTMDPDLSGLPIEMRVLEPKGHFEMDGLSEQLVTFGVIIREERNYLAFPISWKCETLAGRTHTDTDRLTIERQIGQPNWDRLFEDPPYSVNPIKKRENLFGRDEVLNRLLLHASSGTSTFLWGQKRVGKTSILQVLASLLQKKNNFVCVVFRMGELGPLHEGQIGHKIAERLCAQIPELKMPVPTEQSFGAGLGRLIPFFEDIIRRLPEWKFVVIIDEFDDLDPAFYTGERGRLFVKALRSLSEIGLTFFFVGSERMNTIFKRHEIDLNKWVNVSLDCIESKEDCKVLIINPVAGAIEYHPECIDFVIHYCGRNPFYMHLLCSELFNRCYQEQRTYVSESDIQSVRQSLIRTLGVTHFSHFWEDNPELDEEEKARQSAENCLLLCCLSVSGGGYESIDELYTAQDTLGLGISERFSGQDLRKTIERLHNRKIISLNQKTGKSEINLPIFKDWLREYGELQLLPKWREFQKKKALKEEVKEESKIYIAESFPISEDDLLNISQYLIYCGNRKDVSEIRIWLKQFDDDVRIEIAFLLLRRLAEKGFITEGAKLHALEKLQEILRASQLEMGDGAFKVVRGRYDNLCITYIDSEMKSGATLARELAKRLLPGKQGPPYEISDWMRSHSDKNALVLVVDDFAGTGSTISKGLKKFFDQRGIEEVREIFLREGRILCYLLFSFPEAVEKLRKEYPQVRFISVKVFGDEVKALDPNAGIFENEDEISFAKEMLIQIGRELDPQYPLGFGDTGALICFHNTIPNNTLPIFWRSGTVSDKPWRALFPRA
jgi:hypothetical protein